MMHRSLRFALTGSLALGLAAWALPASAGHNADQHSPGFQLLANFPTSTAATQSDLAFQGDMAFVGNYNGFRIFDISDPRNPTLVEDVLCPGPQNDISIWGDAIVLSVDSVRLANPARPGAAASDCDSVAAPAAQVQDPAAWEGLRIFSLSEILSMPPDPDGFTRPLVPATAIYADCGSHTHTGIPHGDHVDVYVSSYPLRSGPGCGPGNPQGEDPLHRKISIVQVDPDTPSNSAFLKEVPIDVPTFDLLVPFGFNPMQGCHDMQVYPGVDLAAVACVSVGQLWDISDPENPDTLNSEWEVDQPEVQIYHSAAFTWDADTVLFGDEIVFGSCDDGTGSGRTWFHDAGDGSTLGWFQIPRAQPGEYCSSHLFTVLERGGRDIMVASWYAGGTTVIDFTDPANPVEIAYYDPAPVAPGDEGYWASYEYNGFIYGNGLSRGFDVLWSAQVRAGDKHEAELNPQTQL